MDPDIDLIAQLSIFTGLNSVALKALTSSLEERRLPAGEVLFRQEDPGDACYIVAEGTLCVHARQPDGSEVPLKQISSGACTGEMALLTGQPRSATVSAGEDARLLCLPKAAFDRLAEEHPDLIERLACELLPRLQEVQSGLALTRLFGPLDVDTLRELYSQMTWRRLECGQVLCRQGEPGDEMYVVVQGRLRFALEEEGGRRDLGEVGAGDSIGEFALLAEEGTPESQRSATIYAVRLSDVLVISRRVFEDFLCRQPRLLLSLTRRIIRREVSITQPAVSKTSAQVVAVLPARPGGLPREFTRQLAGVLGDPESVMLLDPGRFDALYGKPGASQTPLDHPASLSIGAWLDERERAHRTLICEVPHPLDGDGALGPWARRCVENADVVLLVGEGGAGPQPGAVEAALPAARSQARLELVLLHPPDCPVPSGTAAWLAARRAGDCPLHFPLRAHHHVRLGNAADFRRLGRRVSGRPVGLALSGGGARGWAHIGAIRALEEADLEVDWVGGASMGAIIAAGYALDWPSGRLAQLAADFSDPKQLLDYTFPYASITATRRITTLLRDLYAETALEDTWRPCFCVSANLTRGEEQLHTSGTLWKAVRASMAFPGIFAPVHEDGCVLIDGGAANNLPVDRMRELCPTGTVIGVDLVTGSPTRGPYDFGPSLSGWQALRGHLGALPGRVKAPNLLDIVAGVVYSNNRYRLNEVWRCADLLIQVPVEDYGLLEFDRYAQIIELGYAAAKEQLAGFKCPAR